MKPMTRAEESRAKYSDEERKAYQQGYGAYQRRRGLNPYPFTEGAALLWNAWEAGWCQAYLDKAPDLSREELERLDESKGKYGITIFRETLDAKANPAS